MDHSYGILLFFLHLVEAHNATSQKKFPVQKVTLCPDQAPATPLNNAFSNERVEVQAPHSGMIFFVWSPVLTMSEASLDSSNY
jgi:N-acetylglucosamine-6-phosphate deacetylase